MKAFFDKYASRLGEKAAYKLIAAEVKKAVDADEVTGDPLHCLSIAHEMIDDLFELKGYATPAEYRK